MLSNNMHALLSAYLFLLCTSLSWAESMSYDPNTVDPRKNNGKPTYMLTNVHEWESIDHQISSLLTLMSLAQNVSVIPVIPPTLAAPGSTSNVSLVGDYFSAPELQKLQKLITFREFMNSPAYKELVAATPGTVALPKGSQEEYEAQLKIMGNLNESRIRFQMPHEDVESTNQFCDTFPGTVFESPKYRFIFLERVHFFHFCTERFMPWWYNVRARLVPRQPYFTAVKSFIRKLKRPLTVVHIRDLMDMHRTPENMEVERYARQIADSLRRHSAARGTVYLAYAKDGLSVKRVAALLRDEFENVRDCTNLFDCGTKVPFDLFKGKVQDIDLHTMFRTAVGKDLVEWALSLRSDYFIGNVHSPYSRNVAIYRKLRGRSYSIVKGFGEMRKIWRWNL